MVFVTFKIVEIFILTLLILLPFFFFLLILFFSLPHLLSPLRHRLILIIFIKEFQVSKIIHHLLATFFFSLLKNLLIVQVAALVICIYQHQMMNLFLILKVKTFQILLHKASSGFKQLDLLLKCPIQVLRLN